MSILKNNIFNICYVSKLFCLTKFSNKFQILFNRSINFRSNFPQTVEKGYELKLPFSISYFVHSPFKNYRIFCEHNSQLNKSNDVLSCLSNEESDKILNMLMNELHLSKDQAVDFIIKLNFYKISKKNRINYNRLCHLIVTSKKYFKIEDIIACDKLLFYKHKKIEIIMEILKEMDINFSSPNILEIFQVLNSFNEFMLKNCNILDQNCNLVKNMLDKIQNYPMVRKEKIASKLHENTTLDLIFKTILHDILDYYKYNFLPKYNYFSPSKLCKIFNEFKKYDFPFFLDNNIINRLVYTSHEELDYVFNLLNDTPHLLDFVLNEKTLRYIPLSTVGRNIDLLINKYNFTSKEIENSSTYLAMSSEQLQEKLDYITSTFNLMPMQINNFSFLLKKPIERIKSLAINKNDVSFSKSFRNYKSRISKKKIEIIIECFFSQYTQEEKLEILNNLHFHPRLHKIKFKYNMSQFLESLRYLVNNCNLSKQQLIKNPSIIFYSVEELKIGLKELKQRSDYDEWKNDEKMLIMLMYLLEKQNPFESSELTMLKIF